jgi:hypothetical protein
MTTLVARESADSCPDCDARLVLLDDGIATAGLECRSCGYLDTWTLTSRDGGEQ